MSTDFSIKPVGAPVATPIAQPASPAANSAVGTTELPASQSVTAADASARSRNDTDSGVSVAVSDSVSRQAFIDRAAGSIVYQVVDNRTNQVVQQFPDDAALRRRAYFRTLDLTKDTPTGLLATDRKA
jgi:uncharacterized FlaG/YvyC family protein